MPTFILSEQTIRDKYWHIQQGMVVIDVGCNVGIYTLPALYAGATVYAIDPDKECSIGLRKYAERQVCALTVINKALGEECGYPEDLWKAMEEVGSCYQLARDVQFTTLDEIVREYNITRLDWIKIDVEGGELSVLKGATRSLTKFHPALLIEDHSLVYDFVAEMNLTSQIKQLLSSLNYQIEEYYYDKELTPREYLVAK